MRCYIRTCITLIIGAAILLYQYELAKVWMPTSNKHKSINEHDFERISNPDSINTNFTSSNCLNSSTHSRADNDLPLLYIITPTYKRPEQLAELTRLAHTLMLVPNIRWLVVEDAAVITSRVTELLNKTGLCFEQLTAPMPKRYKNQVKGYKPKGVSNRNRGLSWIKENAKNGVLYFADDDNTYDLEIFYEMRFTKRVSMWPVGLMTGLGVSSPVIRNGKFVGFYDGWIGGRKFPVDMAGFAVAVKFLLERPKAFMPFVPGLEEEGFLRSLKPFEPTEIELLASNCTKVSEVM